MMNYKEEWNKIGYNLEELYFEKINRELIKKIKAQQPPQFTGKLTSEQPMAQVLQFKPRSASGADSMKKVA